MSLVPCVGERHERRCELGCRRQGGACCHGWCHRSRATDGAIDRGPWTVPSIAPRTEPLLSDYFLLVSMFCPQCHRSRATDGAIDRGHDDTRTTHGRHTTHGRDRGTQDLPTTLILPLASPIIIIISSSSRRRRNSISRLYGVALSWAILSLTTPKLRS